MKYLGINLPKETKDLYSESYKILMKTLRSRWHRWEKYTIFLNWENQYCENDCTTKSNIQIQCNPCQITNSIFHRARTKNFTIHMETQKTPKSQSKRIKEKQMEGSISLTSDYSTKLQSSKQYDTVTKTEI